MVEKHGEQLTSDELNVKLNLTIIVSEFSKQLDETEAKVFNNAISELEFLTNSEIEAKYGVKLTDEQKSRIDKRHQIIANQINILSQNIKNLNSENISTTDYIRNNLPKILHTMIFGVELNPDTENPEHDSDTPGGYLSHYLRRGDNYQLIDKLSSELLSKINDETISFTDLVEESQDDDGRTNFFKLTDLIELIHQQGQHRNSFSKFPMNPILLNKAVNNDIERIKNFDKKLSPSFSVIRNLENYRKLISSESITYIVSKWNNTKAQNSETALEYYLQLITNPNVQEIMGIPDSQTFLEIKIQN